MDLPKSNEAAQDSADKHARLPAVSDQGGWRRTVKHQLGRVWHALDGYGHPHAAVPQSGQWQLVLYGLAQPLTGWRVLVRYPATRRLAATPVIAFLLMCALYIGFVFIEEGLTLAELVLSLASFIAATAAAPPLVFARHYARLAAASLSLSRTLPTAPHLDSYAAVITKFVKQSLIVAAALVPAFACASLVPGVGAVLVALLTAAWVIHWDLIDALDASRFRRIDGPARELERPVDTPDTLDQPWFVRLMRPRGFFAMRWLLALNHRWLRWFTRWTAVWNDELKLVERHPWTCLGFGLGVAIMLLIPGVNLVFRPILVIAAAHLRASLDDFDRESSQHVGSDAGECASVSQSPMHAPERLAAESMAAVATELPARANEGEAERVEEAGPNGLNRAVASPLDAGDARVKLFRS